MFFIFFQYFTRRYLFDTIPILITYGGELMDYRKSYALKVDETNFEKLRVISKANHRSVNAQIEALISECIAAYESAKGEITILEEK